MSTNLNRADFEAQHAAIWGRHLDEYPADALLTLNWFDDRKRMNAKHTPLADVDAAWDVIARQGTDRPVYVAVAPRMPIVLEGNQNGRFKRGKKSEVYAIPALFADVDVASGSHKSGNLPDRETADRWLADFPLKPTQLWWTGGGYHAWWALDELPTAEAQQEMMLLFKRWWQHRSGQDEKDFDAGVIEPLRIMRAGGSLVGKNGNLAAIELVESN